MKTAFIVLLSFTVFSASSSLLEVRKLYFSEITSKEESLAFIDLLKNAEEGIEIEGYRAGATMISSKYEFSPFSKLSTFSDGKEALENIIEEHPNNLELRLIRLTIQENAPNIVHYNDKIETDRAFLKFHKPSLSDFDLINRIESYLNKE